MAIDDKTRLSDDLVDAILVTISYSTIAYHNFSPVTTGTVNKKRRCFLSAILKGDYNKNEIYYSFSVIPNETCIIFRINIIMEITPWWIVFDPAANCWDGQMCTSDGLSLICQIVVLLMYPEKLLLCPWPQRQQCAAYGELVANNLIFIYI
ncbi:hypothetical protein PV328_004100 [Microctonus aethiopoides]|uniref:Uncharacterized protein n=1 Tax=Microctonus aethiopoides TaxID=144406 RepID=A0AA39KLC8_9HYME|nr:hypothetical protein PV328_004100 [Microctonus aethiopoides]